MQEFYKVGEGIFKAQNTLSKEDCEYLFDFIYQNTNFPVEDPSVVPWEISEDMRKSNVLYYPALPVMDRRALDIMNSYKATMAKVLSEIHQEEIYPHLTTLVLWKPGQKMPRHVDDGSGSESHHEMLKMRKYTSVTYINDNFEGGETFVRSDGKTEPDFRVSGTYRFPNSFFTDYISKPETGATILFGGDDKNAHGVNELKNGLRVVLSTWFTTDKNAVETVL